MSDIIFAFSSPAVSSALQVLRISGAGSAKWLDRWFRFGPLPKGDNIKSESRAKVIDELPGYQAAYGYLFDPHDDEPIDQAVILRYRAPHSYTGEEMVEVSLHGSMAVRTKVLEVATRLGGRMAEAGEFTERAFLNGKLDLTQVEAVIDLIDARADRTAQQALKRLGGGLSEVYQGLRNALIDVIAELQLAIDYPEHEDSILEVDVLRRSLESIVARCEDLLKSYRQGKALQEGFAIVLLGPPNAGKSSLLNKLVQQDRAIVSDIPGTTRDTIEVSLIMDGIPVRWIDTAGLRNSNDPIEKMGIERSELAAQEADLIFYLVPSDEDLTQELITDIAGFRKHAPLHVLRSKSDLTDSGGSYGDLDSSGDLKSQASHESHKSNKLHQSQGTLSEQEPLFTIPISVTDGTGIDKIFDVIAQEFAALGPPQSESILVSSEREHGILLRVQDRLMTLLADVGILPEDLLAQALLSIAEEVSELTGHDMNEAVLENLFARFCVGK